MSMPRLHRTLSIAAFCAISAGQALAQPAISLYRECYAKFGTACIAYAAQKDGVSLRERPNASARVVQQVPFASLVLLLEPFERKDSPGWLYSRGLDENRSAHIAWVRRDDIAAAWDFHRVVDCWPVSELRWTEEETAGYEHRALAPRFDPKGKIIVETPEEQEWYRGLAVYYARGIFRVSNASDPQGALSPTFALDYPRRQVSIKLEYRGEPGNPSFRFAPPELFEKCQSIPTADAKQPMRRMPKPAGR